jgi:uncharacterized protein (DUF1786 family)
MKILTVDVGTGTQDIFLFDSRVDIENGFKLIVPSPTMMVHRQIKAATRRGEPILLQGVMMGGGPSSWAAEHHLKAGLHVYATPQAARTINDDLDAVRELGIQLVSDDEAQSLPPEVRRLALRDFDFPAIAAAFEQFGVSLDDLQAVSVAVFDHGDAPPEVSDRQFRFDYLDERIRQQNRLSAFAYPETSVPSIMTRLQAVVESARSPVGGLPESLPLVVMDTAPAAVLGATFDPLVSQRPEVLIANVGNFHTLAFRLGAGGIEGVFEHHTGLLDVQKLESLLTRLAQGTLAHEEVFGDHGHGALVYNPQPMDLDQRLAQGEYGVVVTGPRRSLLRGSHLKPYFAVPFGDMMIAGCFGLLAATADALPELREPIQASLSGAGGASTPPWEID